MQRLFFFLLLISTLSASAQHDTMQPAYQRYPEIPGLQLLTLDSAKFTKADLPKKKPVLLMLFSPDCDHCQHEAGQISRQKERFKNIQLLLVSTYPLHRLKAFAAEYGLQPMENVIVTKDPYYVLPAFYALRNFPYLALYDKKGKLIRTFEGSVGTDKILAAFEKGK